VVAGYNLSLKHKLTSARENGENAFIVGQHTIQLESVMSVSRVRLYVKSVKTVTGTIKVERLTVTRSRLPPTVRTETKREYILPEAQQRTVEMIKNIASKYGLEVKVVDVARENVFHRAIQEEREKIRAFPALLADSGERIEDNITEEQAEHFLSRIADRTRKKYL
jgi:hypothetical protein